MTVGSLRYGCGVLCHSLAPNRQEVIHTPTDNLYSFSSGIMASTAPLVSVLEHEQ